MYNVYNQYKFLIHSYVYIIHLHDLFRGFDYIPETYINSAVYWDYGWYFLGFFSYKHRKKYLY